MKKVFPFLSFFLLASCLVQADNQPVLDMSGKELQTDADYFILPYNVSYGGGLSLAATRDKTCPLEVVLHVERYDDEIPVTFHPANTKDGVVLESTDLNIKFKTITSCTKSTVMKVDNYDRSRKRYYLTVGGVEGNPGYKTIKNWFKIEKYNDNYKLMYCPTICEFCKVVCKNVGAYDDVYDDTIPYSVFALRSEPQMVMFRKA